MLINHSHLPSSISRPPNVDNPSLLLTNFFLSFMPFSLFYDPLVLTRSVSVTKTLELSTGICWYLLGSPVCTQFKTLTVSLLEPRSNKQLNREG